MGLPLIRITYCKYRLEKLDGAELATVLKWDDEGYLVLWTEKRERKRIHRTDIRWKLIERS
jgi:hypothetical protein